MVNLPAGAALGVAGADITAAAAAVVLRALLPASGDLLALPGERLCGLLALLAVLPIAAVLGSLLAAAASAAAGRVPACGKPDERAGHAARQSQTDAILGEHQADWCGYKAYSEYVCACFCLTMVHAACRRRKC